MTDIEQMERELQQRREHIAVLDGSLRDYYTRRLALYVQIIQTHDHIVPDDMRKPNTPYVSVTAFRHDGPPREFTQCDPFGFPTTGVRRRALFSELDRLHEV